MPTSGLSEQRMSRMHAAMAGYVRRGDVPGMVNLVSRRGDVNIDAIGLSDETTVSVSTAGTVGSAPRGATIPPKA